MSSSFETRIERLENPNTDGRRFGVVHLAEDLRAAIERIKVEGPRPWSERKDLDEDEFTHPLDRELARQINAARRRMKKLEAEDHLQRQGPQGEEGR